MKFTISLLLALFSVLNCYAQIEFESGYFIDNSGTKTECLIKNLAWKNNPTEFSYKVTESTDIQVATIKEVSEFKVSGYKYKRFTVNIDQSKIALSKLSITKEPEYKQQTVFLNVLLEGDANLYEYLGENYLFFISVAPHEKAEQLVYKSYMVNDQIAKNNRFRQQLYSVMNSRLNNLGLFEKLEYQEKPLIKLFTAYNGDSTSKTNNFSERKNKIVFNMKILVGAGLTSFKVKNFLSGDSHDFENTPTYRVGVEAEVILPFNNSKWSLFADPVYQTFSKGEKGVNGNWNVRYDYIELAAGLRHYMFLNKSSKLFLNAGYALAETLDGGYLKLRNDTTLNLNTHGNFIVGAGFSTGRYSIEGRYGFNREILNTYVYWRSDYKTATLNFAYKVF